MAIKRGQHKRGYKFVMNKFNKLPCMRSCWNCNSGHDYLKEVSYPFWCFGCGSLYYKGQRVEEDKKDE